MINCSFETKAGVLVSVVMLNKLGIISEMEYIKDSVEENEFLELINEIKTEPNIAFVQIKGEKEGRPLYSNVNLIYGITIKEVVESFVYSEVLLNFEGSESCVEYFSRLI